MLRRGFTLVETAVVLALVGLLTATAVPAWQGHVMRAARADAVSALTRLQIRQERHHETIGWYASSLAALGHATTSAEGRYRIELVPRDADAYVARAHAVGVQERDRECLTITLEVQRGMARTGPSARCWNR